MEREKAIALQKELERAAKEKEMEAKRRKVSVWSLCLKFKEL